MQKTILITGSTDGIGLETSKILVSQGHKVLLHGRNPSKLEKVAKELAALPGEGQIESYLADLSCMDEVEVLANAVAEKHARIDVLINNAGVLQVADSLTRERLDVRFAVNTLAPYLLTKLLLPLLGTSGRVVNLSSAAQTPVNLEALAGRVELHVDMVAYAQSKLALTMWSRIVGHELKESGPVIVAVNPGSLLASKMVKEAFGMIGKDIRIGADILYRAALSDEFSTASGQYFDNDSGRFSSPHADALNPEKSKEIVDLIESVLAKITGRTSFNLTFRKGSDQWKQSR